MATVPTNQTTTSRAAPPSPAPKVRIPTVRISPDNESVLKNLGLLKDLAGTWRGHGFNLIARPDRQGSSNLYLQLNQTRETLTIDPIGSSISNRGFGQDERFTLSLASGSRNQRPIIRSRRRRGRKSSLGWARSPMAAPCWHKAPPNILREFLSLRLPALNIPFLCFRHSTALLSPQLRPFHHRLSMQPDHQKRRLPRQISFRPSRNTMLVFRKAPRIRELRLTRIHPIRLYPQRSMAFRYRMFSTTQSNSCNKSLSDKWTRGTLLKGR